MLLLKTKYGTHKPIVDFNILRWPAFMSPLTLPDDIKHDLHGKLSMWWRKHKKNPLINMHEGAQIQRLIDYLDVVKTPHSEAFELDKLRNDFKQFYSQYDQRRSKDFVKTFPALADWYNSL